MLFSKRWVEASRIESEIKDAEYDLSVAKLNDWEFEILVLTDKLASLRSDLRSLEG
ncbi:hypothetical protein [Clostridium sp.]|uniref:hypothetical protein n=1 Tax=Clostridium sp. TaxID=1506 RepID=UPI003F2C44BA